MSDVGVIIDLDDSDVEQSKAVLDYTSRDYTAIRAQLVGLAKGLYPDWETAGEAPDFGTLLLELFAYMGDVMHFYIDRTASEAFLGTAVRRQSVLYIADMLGYVPVGQAAAIVQLQFSLEADDPNNPGTVVPVTIPQGTRVYNSSNDADAVVVFEMDTQIALQPGNTNVIGYASEGISIEGASMGVAQGVPNTEFIIPDVGVIYGTVKVYTQEGAVNVEWTYVSHLADARPTQAVFTTFMDEEAMTHVVFGDNAAGRIPPVNAQMYVNYRYGVGAAANNLPANSIDTIAPIANVDLFGVSVTNPASPIGGSDPESIDSMRYSVSRGGAKMRDRAVTLNDFADLALQVPGVVKSVSYGTVYTAVHVRIAPPDGKANDVYMAQLCNATKAYLQDKVMVGSTVYIEPFDVDDLWQDIYIRVLVHVQPAFNRTSVRSQVESVVRSLLSFNNVDFGTRVSVGLIYRAVLAVQGVEFAELQWLSTEPPPNEHAFPAEAPSGGSTATTVTTLLVDSIWHYSTVTTIADPGTGTVRLNSTTNPTQIALAMTDAGGTNRTTVLSALQPGDHIVFSEVLVPGNWLSLVLTAAPAGSGTWRTLTVARVGTATAPPEQNQDAEISIIRYAPNPATPTGDVVDINTDELLIPRIEPTEVEEPEAEYPTMTDDERTHDGLWIKAVGGAVNT